MKNAWIMLLVTAMIALCHSCDSITETGAGVQYELVLEIAEDQALRDLAGKAADSLFEKTLEKAKAIHRKTNQKFLDAFVEAAKQNGNPKLDRWFPLHQANLPPEASQAELIMWLREHLGDLANRNLQIITQRALRFEANQATVTMDSIDRQIKVKALDVVDPERFRSVLTAPSKLEFWRTETRSEAYPTILAINELSKEMEPVDSSQLPVADLFGLSPEEEMQEFKVLNPFLRLFDLEATMDPDRSIMGYALEQDTAKMNFFIQAAMKAGLLGRKRLLWMKDAETLVEGEAPLIALVCIRMDFDERPPLDGSYIESALVDFDAHTADPIITLQMDEKGGEIWQNLTRDEIKRPIAIVFDDKVLLAPMVQDEIKGGKTEISGDFTVESAQDLAAMLAAGALVAPVRVVKERVGE